MPATLHVVFTDSGAAALREALKASGRDERVVCIADNFGFGPIDPADPETRKTWVEQELGFTGWPSTPEQDGDRGWEEVAANTNAFWNESLSPRYRKIAWMTRRSAMEHAGFLEWLWRLGDAPCEVVDLTEVMISKRPSLGPPRLSVPAISVAALSFDEIHNNNLWDLAEPLQLIARDQHLDLWRKLRTENAALRVIEGNELVSAPISFFDPLLLSYTKANWQKVAKVVGKALHDQAVDGVFQMGEMLLAARIGFLVNNGFLEFQGRSPFAMRFSEVRLPRPRA